MSTASASHEAHDEPEQYEIRIKGHLDNRWAGWFSDLTITREDNGETRLTGALVDQAALYGDRYMTTTEEITRAPKAKRIVTANQRRAEVVIATLFLVTAAVSIPGAFLLDSVLNASNYLSQTFANQGAVELGALMWSINNIGIVFIAVFAFGVLRKLDEALAAGYLACRIIEGTIMMGGVAATLLLIPLSQEFLQSGASQVTLGDILKQAKFLGLTGLSLPLLGLGGVLFTSMLFRYRLVPRGISAVGLIGYTIVLVGSIAGWFGLIDVAPGGNGTILALPVATFEIVLLPFWLFFRGFETQERPERIVATE